jgi:hypothetical protein
VDQYKNTKMRSSWEPVCAKFNTNNSKNSTIAKKHLRFKEIQELMSLVQAQVQKIFQVIQQENSH